MASLPPPRSRDDFKIAVICALPLEADMVDAMFDKYWVKEGIDLGKAPGDQNAYTIGVMGKHNVVLAHMPSMGGNPAASVSAAIRSSFPQIEIAFVVGICGVSPTHPDTGDEIILGDCILSTTVVQYDFGRQISGHFIRKTATENILGQANPTIRSLVNQLQLSRNLDELSERLAYHLESLQNKPSRRRKKAEYPGASNDYLFEISHLHTHHNTATACEDCSQETSSCAKDCDALGCSKTIQRTRLTEHAVQSGMNKPQVHFGRYGSANTVLRSSIDRERLAKEDKITAFEMEGAGVWNNLPTIIVKSACDYADSHKNKDWQPYAAATAAAVLKAILNRWSTTDSTKISAQVSINVPDHMVTHFVPRLNILQNLDSWLLDSTQTERMILHGMGGAGKSQLALACCKKALESGQFATVLWLDASSVFSIEQSLKLVVSGLEESQAVRPDAKENLSIIARAIQHRQGAWLIVFDNFDTPSAFNQVPIINYIPKVEFGKVLFTSRDAVSSERLGRTIQVSGMSEDESLQLLLKRPTRDSSERAAGLQIANELGHLALALDQAQAYIRARKLPLEDFIKHFKKRKKMILQEIPQNWEYRRSVINGEQDVLLSAFTTWELSFEQISGSTEVKHFKGHFLTLCAFFDPTSISKEYFESYCRRGPGLSWTSIFINEEGVWDGFLFDDVVAECRMLSLLQMDDQDQTQSLLSLHPLVRDWLKLRRTPQEEQDIAQEFTDLLVLHNGSIDFNVIGQTRRKHLLANIVSCVEEDNRFKDILQYNTNDLRNSATAFANIYWLSGFYSESAGLLEQALAGYREHFGSEHPDTLSSMANLANVYAKRGRYDDAEELYKQVLLVREEVLGSKHLDTLWVTGRLGDVHGMKGKYNDAEQLLGRTLTGYREQLGSKHPKTLSVMVNLSIVYVEKRRYNDAEELVELALTGFQQLLGSKHFETLRTMRKLANVYIKQGRYVDAEKLQKQALVGFQELLGPKHHDTLRTMRKLAIVYTDTGRYDDAEKLLGQTLVGLQEQLGPKHPDTLKTMVNMANLYSDRGRYDDAEELYRQVLAGREEILGPEHPDTLLTIVTLANFCGRRQNYNYAEEMYKLVLAGIQEQLGFKHTESLRAMENLTNIHFGRDGLDDAEELCRQVLEGREEMLGSKHPDTLWIMEDLANIYFNTGRYDDAEELYKQVLESREEVLGSRHPDTRRVLEYLASNSC